jgi:lipoprotein NlpI
MGRAQWQLIAGVLVATIAALAAPPALAQSQQQIDSCANRDGVLTPDAQINACTSLIQSGQKLGQKSGQKSSQASGKSSAPYYANRCWAYKAKGDYDSAMQDCNEAIRIDPANARAFGGRGAMYGERGEVDRAIAEFNEAIRLDPKSVSAFNNRGTAYKAKGEFDRAIAEFNEAIRLDPKSAIAFNNRGDTYKAKNDLDRAIADYDEAIRLDPKFAKSYFGRGIANLYGGSLPKALADLDRASKLDPKDAYAALWRDIVDKRSNPASRLPQDISQIDMTRWPAPAIRMFLGQMKPEAVLAAADNANAYTKRGQVCEANFYSGELALQQGAKDQATRLFRLTVAECPKDFIELHAANAELKTLGVKP